jgi:ATP-binding protein involved in chromosome partitioning
MNKKDKMPLPGVQKIILVVSGKGGVGKSTVAANLALSLQQQGFNVGLLDADIYGPSIPKMFNIQEKPKVIDNQFVPFTSHGLKLMSMGFLVPEDSAVIWRGPMTTKALHQLFRMTKWAAPKTELDYLIVDTPPGTGDVHLSIVENYLVEASIVVSTPQALAVIDAFKAVDMLKKLNIKIVGMLENMAYLTDENGHKKEIFGKSKLSGLCHDKDITYLGKLPILSEVSEAYFFPDGDDIYQKTLQQITDRIC